jgi:peroxiredoxin Q/BCP
MSPVPEFSLPNVGPGPDPFSLGAVGDDVSFVLLFFQRDYHCIKCRQQVQALAERHDAFLERDAIVVSVLPEPAEQAREWVRRYDLPFPLLADDSARVSDAFDQPVRFGALGSFSDFFGRMPQIVALDVREEPVVAWVDRGRSTFDRPSIDEILDVLDRRQEDR